MNRLASIFAALTLTVIAPTLSFAASPCKERPDVVGECFTVHGRLFFANGNPSFRIWRIGTKRILGIHQSNEQPIVPDSLANVIAGLVNRHVFDDQQIFGDFRVCPLTVERKEWMQSVCVDSASKLVVRDR